MRNPNGHATRFVVAAVIVATAGIGAGGSTLAAGSSPPVASSPRAPRATESKADPLLLRQSALAPNATLPLIVRETDPSTTAAERAVASLGGHVTRELPIVGSFAARLPAGAVPALLGQPSVARVWADAHLQATGSDMAGYDTYAPNTVWKKAIEPTQASAQNGAGATVALIDTGVTELPDLGNRVLARVDLTPDHDGFDRFGHGTHMAGIIAGDGTSSGGQWAGAAPQADLVSVKVAGADGSTDVSVVIAAMQWVVAHRAQYDIRVLNLSYGTDARQSYLLDPLDHAVEQVWFSGIFVVVAAGNDGPGAGTVSKPGDDPFVLTVGAVDTQNTPNRNDDVVPDFSGRGPTQDAVSKPDLVAPGISVVSGRALGSTVDDDHPAARLDDHYLKGTGTSQATAVVSGVAATMFALAPSLTPDLAKAILLRTADHKILRDSSGWAAGAGMIDADAAIKLVKRGYVGVLPANLGVVPSTGLGSLEGSRGSAHVLVDLDGDGLPDLVSGEIDVLGNPWNPGSWDGNSWDGNSWSGYTFLGNSWDANTWDGNSWGGMSWDSNSWDGNSWDGASWN